MQTVRIHLFDDYDPQERYDLVLALHGYGGDVAEFSCRWTAFDEGNLSLPLFRNPTPLNRTAGQYSSRDSPMVQ